MKNKNIPFPAQDRFKAINHEDFPKAFKPSEKFCHSFRKELSGPFGITHRARILTHQGFLGGIETFFKHVKIITDTKNMIMMYITLMTLFCKALVFASS